MNSGELRQTTWKVRIPFSEDAWSDVSLSLQRDEELCRMIVWAQSLLWYENLKTIEYPADWWQAFKARWLPKWAKQRWLVRYKRFEINAYYPSFKPTDPTGRGYVRLPRMDDLWEME